MRLAAWFGRAPATARGLGLGLAGAWKFVVALLLLILAGSSGAVAALGNTLFPAETLAAGVRMDFDPSSHILVRLRVWHPVLAVAAAGWVLWVAIPLASDGRRRVGKWAVIAGGLVTAQVVAGFVNLLLLAPVWMQLTHLLLADCLWMATVVLGAAALSREG
jgi:heme A synthase